MSTKPKEGALAYLDEQIEALKTHTPAALDAFDKTGIHQARVGTRRLKAGLDLLKPLLEADDLSDLQKAGRKLRRRLGPLRDLDVMIDHLRAYPASPRLKPAAEWIAGQFEQVRGEVRQADQKKGKKAHKLLDDFDAWWGVRQKLKAADAEAIGSLLAHALHERFDQFAQVADVVSGVAEAPADKQIDVHELRIDGKALRYTFELADAHGIKVPKSIFKTFKAMQESLGTWHDYVVLADETVKRWAEVELALHDPESASLVLDLAKQFLKDSAKRLQQFKAKWKRSGPSIRKALHDRVPLTVDVSDQVNVEEVKPSIDVLTEPKTDPDRPEQAASSPAGTPALTEPADEPR